MDIFERSGALPVWSSSINENQYVDFFREFTVGEASGATLYICAETEYVVYINGRFAACNQFDDFPDERTYDTVDMTGFLQKGRNSIAVLSYHQGRNSFQYIESQPFLIYTLRTDKELITSGDEWCREDLCYKSGEMELVSVQHGFSFRYRALPEEDWLRKDYAAAGWEKASVCKASSRFSARPVKKLELLPPLRVKVSTQGVFLNGNSGILPLEQPPSVAMEESYLKQKYENSIFGAVPKALPDEGGLRILPQTACDGVYLLVDFGKEEAGFFSVDIDAPEDTIVDIGCGEHIEDLRVLTHTGGRNYAFRYICGQGRHSFTHYPKRIAGRYLELHFHTNESFVLYYAGIVPVRYPLSGLPGFRSEDRLLNKIYEVSRRTLELCIHEHYEDCPYREQALYAMDSRNQMLCGYYAFGEYDFPLASLRLLAKSQREDGFLELCAPCKFERAIPSFSLIYIRAVWEYVLYSGRYHAGSTLYPTVERILQGFLSYMNDEYSVAEVPSAPRYWNFYEWADGLDNFDEKLEAPRYDAPLNFFLLCGLDAAIALGRLLKRDTMQYENWRFKLAKGIQSMFWDGSQYCTYSDGNRKWHCCELVQALAVYTDTALEPDALCRRLMNQNGEFIGVTLSYSIYKYEALLRNGFGPWVFEDISEKWGSMLFKGATSFWETLEGQEAFGKAGSLCHGWSAVPLYLLGAYAAGFRPSVPGEFMIRPLQTGIHELTARFMVPRVLHTITVNDGRLGSHKTKEV